MAEGLGRVLPCCCCQLGEPAYSCTPIMLSDCPANDVRAEVLPSKLITSDLQCESEVYIGSFHNVTPAYLTLSMHALQMI